MLNMRCVHIFFYMFYIEVAVFKRIKSVFFKNISNKIKFTRGLYFNKTILQEKWVMFYQRDMIITTHIPKSVTPKVFGQSQKALVLPLSLGIISLCCGIPEVVSSSGMRMGEWGRVFSVAIIPLTGWDTPDLDWSVSGQFLAMWLVSS